MCAIIDTNAAIELIGKTPPEAGQKFLDVIESGRMVLVLGGQLRVELNKTPFRRWIQQMQLAGNARVVEDGKVQTRTSLIVERGGYISNDPHIVALAQVTGARLLYTNDNDLQTDFRDKALLDNPRGRIYTTLVNKRYSTSHKTLLNRRDLCRLS